MFSLFLVCFIYFGACSSFPVLVAPFFKETHNNSTSFTHTTNSEYTSGTTKRVLNSGEPSKNSEDLDENSGELGTVKITDVKSSYVVDNNNTKSLTDKEIDLEETTTEMEISAQNYNDTRLVRYGNTTLLNYLGQNLMRKQNVSYISDFDILADLSKNEHVNAIKYSFNRSKDKDPAIGGHDNDSFVMLAEQTKKVLSNLTEPSFRSSVSSVMLGNETINGKPKLQINKEIFFRGSQAIGMKVSLGNVILPDSADKAYTTEFTDMFSTLMLARSHLDFAHRRIRKTSFGNHLTENELLKFMNDLSVAQPDFNLSLIEKLTTVQNLLWEV